MKNNRRNNGIKAAVFSLLGILLLSGIFITANRLIFANATEREISLPITNPDPPVLYRTDAVPVGFPFPDFYIHDMNPGSETSPNALTAEEAALLGAKYIWEMFEVDISGTNMYMGYSSFPSSTRTHWGGQVAVFGTLYPEWYPEWWFSFAIDSITGERIEIRDYRRGDFEIFEGNFDQQVAALIEIAEIYALRHFNFTEIENISYEGMRSLDGYRRYLQCDEGIQHPVITGDPCCHIWGGETLLSFSATDETGRAANLAISMETQRLAYLTTRHNDIIPGWEAAPDGGRYAMEEYGPQLTLSLGARRFARAIQRIDAVDSHIFCHDGTPAIFLEHLQNVYPGDGGWQFIVMGFDSELFPVRTSITRRRADQIGHNYSVQFIDATNHNSGGNEDTIPILDDGFDYFYFVRAWWPEGYITYIFRVNSGNQWLQEYPHSTPTPMPDYAGYTSASDLVWYMPPTLEHSRIRNIECGNFVGGEYLERICPSTGLFTGDWCAHSGIGPMIVFDNERQLIGHPGSDTIPGLIKMIGMHPFAEFEAIRAANPHVWSERHNPTRSLETGGLMTIENVDSSMRRYFNIGLNQYSSDWGLYPEAYSGRFAVMYNFQFVTDFIFDGASPLYYDWGQVTNISIIPMSLEGRWGLVDYNGNTVLPFMFENLVLIDSDTAFAKYNGRYGVLDLNSTMISLRGV
ncbi:MAG: WG repeat-containing protein [Defluviitaleaceae bacterium]|nr:WG repeat-containing protein [Defluviitaleaceae bacterium]